MSREACPKPLEERAGCPWKETRRGCFSDVHHLYWPRSDYSTPTEKRFRELPENKEQTCRWEHDEAHQESAPSKPSIEEMKAALGQVAVEGDHEAA